MTERRNIQNWTDISAIIAAGEKPDLKDIGFVLRFSPDEPPPDVRAYLADELKEGRWKLVEMSVDGLYFLRSRFPN